MRCVGVQEEGEKQWLAAACLCCAGMSKLEAGGCRTVCHRMPPCPCPSTAAGCSSLPGLC